MPSDIPTQLNGVRPAIRAAREALSEVALALSTAPPEMCADLLDRCAYQMGELVGAGLLERPDVGDLLTGASLANGLLMKIGANAVQEALAAGLMEGERSARESGPYSDGASGRALPEDDTAGDANTPEASADIKAWPIMESKAMHGIVGKIARLATADSEADPVAVITTTLTWAAAELGRNQFIRIGDDVHHSRHFGAVVGASSRARKGTSTAPVRRIFTEAERIRLSPSTLPFPSGSKLKVSNGPLLSGEGLVYAVRDKSEDDEGVPDKRILCVEGELGAAFRAFQRTGNNLSMILRMAFDGLTIAPLIKNNRTFATDPHINVIGHITRHELKELLLATEIWNGLGNRFMWVCARRPKMVAFPKPMPDNEVAEIATELAHVIRLAHSRKDKELVMSNSAMHHWAMVYPELTEDHAGVLGAVTSRAETHARRLALTYAQLDGADRIEIEHLEAALAFVRFAGDCAGYLFGGVDLDPAAQRILEALATGPRTQSEISDLFDRHLPKDRLRSVLTDLQERGRITMTSEKTAGAPRKVWRKAS